MAPIPPPPGDLPPEILELSGALAVVAARAFLLRLALQQSWGPHTADVQTWALEALDEALDALELASPAMHAKLAQQQTAALARFRRDLGLPPA